jgi:hypothetical protein
MFNIRYSMIIYKSNHNVLKYSAACGNFEVVSVFYIGLGVMVSLRRLSAL